jgi:hypothetical protein
MLLLLVLVAVLVAPRFTYSCGPFFEQTVFSYAESPNVPLTKFYAGELGVLRPAYSRSYLIIAYRYLTDLGLSPDAQKALLNPQGPQSGTQNLYGENPEQNPAVMAWAKARARVPDPPKPNLYGQFAPVSKDDPYQQFLNCPDDAFITAARTLDDRIGKYGSGNDIKDWLVAQDAVFANCSAAGPAVLPAALTAGPPWLKADRSYQTAAANFYSRNFDEALKLFDAIAVDHSSPWSQIAPYLAARTMIRKATLAAKDQPFDPATMADAEARLQKLLIDPTREQIRQDVRHMLGFVRFRTHPAERVAELETEILKKNPGADFHQDFNDYLRLARSGEQAADLSDWLRTLESGYNNREGKERRDAQSAAHAVQQWHENKTLPWLIAALELAEPNDPVAAGLLYDAAKVPAQSPAYLSVRYDALRLMIGSGRKTEARKELDGILAQPSLPAGVRNLFVEERLPLAASFDDFLKYAAETPAGLGIDENFGDNVPPVQPGTNPPPVFLDTYAAKIFAKRLPLDLYGEAATSSLVPTSLQRDLALAGWTRAILLDDMPAAARLAPLVAKLEPTLQTDLQAFQAASSDSEKKFAAIFLILKHPGLKPYVVQGAGRQQAFQDTGREPLTKIDDLRDNWWCASMGADPGSINYYENELAADGQKPTESSFKDTDPNFPYPQFVSPAQRTDAIRQWEGLSKLGTAPNYLSQQVVDWANSHPEDQRVPEVLDLAVRSTRYGCTNKLTTKYSKNAFDLLHQKYPQSEWAKKTRYYF